MYKVKHDNNNLISGPYKIEKLTYTSIGFAFHFIN